MEVLVDRMKFENIQVQNFEEIKLLWDNTREIIATKGDQKNEIAKFVGRNPKSSFLCRETKSGNVIGTILCGHDGRRGFLYHLAVHVDYRNRQIATKLIQKSMAQLEMEGIKRCLIFIKKDNDGGKQFWEKMECETVNDLGIMSIEL